VHAKELKPVRVTASIGVAELDGHARDLPGLLASAAKALYHAKRTGRNRIVFSESLDPFASKN